MKLTPKTQSTGKDDIWGMRNRNGAFQPAAGAIQSERLDMKHLQRGWEEYGGNLHHPGFQLSEEPRISERGGLFSDMGNLLLLLSLSVAFFMQHTYYVANICRRERERERKKERKKEEGLFSDKNPDYDVTHTEDMRLLVSHMHGETDGKSSLGGKPYQDSK